MILRQRRLRAALVLPPGPVSRCWHGASWTATMSAGVLVVGAARGRDGNLEPLRHDEAPAPRLAATDVHGTRRQARPEGREPLVARAHRFERRMLYVSSRKVELRGSS